MSRAPLLSLLLILPAQLGWARCNNLPSCKAMLKQAVELYGDPATRTQGAEHFYTCKKDLESLSSKLRNPPAIRSSRGISNEFDGRIASDADIRLANEMDLEIMRYTGLMRAATKAEEERSSPCGNNSKATSASMDACGKIMDSALTDYTSATEKNKRDAAYWRFQQARSYLSSLPSNADPNLIRKGLDLAETGQKSFDTLVGAQGAGRSTAIAVIEAGQANDNAAALEKKLVDAGSNDPSAYENAAQGYVRGDNPQGAERAIDRALQLKPESPEALALRAQLRLARGDAEAARQDAAKALTLDPKNLIARVIVGQADALAKAGGRAKLGQVGFASTAEEPGAGGGPAANPWQRASGGGAPDPSPKAGLSWQAAAQRAAAKMRVSDYTGALLEVSRALDQDPKNAQAYALRAEISNRLKNHAGALRDAEEALRLEPENAQAMRAKAYAQLELGQLREALLSIERAIALEPRNAMGHLYRGMILEKLGDAARALAAYEEAARLDPSLEPLLDEARKRLGGSAAAPAQALPHSRLVFRGTAMLIALALVLLGLLGAAAKHLTTRSRRGGTPAPAPEDLPVLVPGAILGGNFRIDGELGRGGMGVVHEAFDLTLQRRVAIKQLQRDAHTSSEDFERFLAEARLVATLKHPHLAEIYSVVQQGDLFLVFEYVDGRTLDAVLSQNGRIPLPQSRRLLGEMCSALDYAHQQKVIHRDLKPANVMLSADGSVKIMDFGIAHRSQTASNFTKTAASGTPPYMAPEQAMGSVSKVSDIYALGVMAYEMLTGIRPFDGPDFLGQKLEKRFLAASARNPALPAALDAVLAAALDPDPTKRPPSAGEFQRRLEAACG